jgi:hypothetical protein
VALLLALLLWNGKGLCDRIHALERNQEQIMIHLGIYPVATGNVVKQGHSGVVAAVERNQ